MAHLEWRHHRRTELAAHPFGELGESNLERQLGVGGSGIQPREDLFQPLARRRRARDHEGARAVAETTIQNQPGKTAKVISVQVR